jgi:acyl-CoA synthetase (AMP-forming)/AMP-acid ligase II
MTDLLGLVSAHARRAGSKVAIARWQPGGRYVETTFAALVQNAQGLERWMAADPQPGDFVPMLASKSAASIACMLAAIAVGRPFCFLNPKYRGPQITAVLEATRARMCVVDAAGILALRGAWQQHPRLADTTWVLLPGTQLTGIYQDAAAELRATARVVELGDSAPAANLHWDAHRQLDPRAAAACLFTSGSTGQPKGVLIGAADLIDRTMAEIDWFGLTPDDVLLSILPFSFDVGLNQLLTALAVGAEIVLLDSWLPADILATVERLRVTGISAVPAIWQDMIQSGMRFDRAGRHRPLRYVTVSGGSLAPTHLERLPEVVDRADVFKTYGQTETFRSTSLRPEDFGRKPDSVGRPFPGTRVYVVREDGTQCVPGEAGEVVHSGLGIMLGYLAPDGTVQSNDKKRPNPFSGPADSSPNAVFTGDWGHMDEEGYLFLHGRRDGMLKVMGNRVYPQEVTNQVLALPDVRDALALGLPVPDGQSTLVVFIVPAASGELTVASVRKRLNQRLPAYMVPKDMVFVERIPRSAAGKPDQSRLLTEYAACEARLREEACGLAG